MRNLKKFVRGIVACAVMSAGILVSSCDKDMKQQNGNAGTTDIVLDIPMLKAETKAPVQGTAEEDAIHTLRVIILSQGAESINKVLKSTPDKAIPNPILIEKVPVGQVQMYVIANEAALGRNYGELSVLQGEVDKNLKKVLIKDENRIYFPKRGSEFIKDNENIDPEVPKGLPMSWMNKDLTINPPQFDENNKVVPQPIEVELERCVAKLNIIMQSTLSEDLVIKSMNFGAFFGDQLYLFRETDLDVPDATEYEKKSYGDENNPLNITIPANGEETLVCYIYPSFAWKDPDKTSPYTIGFVSDKATYQPKYFVENYRVLNSIARNKQVNITAKLSKPANIDITFEVVPWDPQTVDVPSFN